MVVKSNEKQGPEESSMNENGVFREYNTVAPKETAVMPLFSLKHRTAIVSGAGAGIGLQVAEALAEAGANVAIWYHGNKKALDRAADIEKKYGVKCELIYATEQTHVNVDTVKRQSLCDRHHRLRRH